jgi:xylulokinase
LPPEKYPPIYRCDAIIGEVTPAATEATGIPAGTPVLAGVTDTPAAMLGMGIARAGQAFVSHGTGCNIGLCATGPSPNRHLVCIPHALPERWMLDAVMTSTGAAMKWFVNTLCAQERDAALHDGEDPYRTVTADVAGREPGSGGLLFLPYLMGEQAPIWDVDARATFVGISADTIRGDLVRALMEGVAFGIRQNLQVFEAAGWPVADIRVQGGAARNATWNQILSDVTNRTVLVPPASAGAPIGDALLVGLATGIYPDVATTVAAAPPIARTFRPDADAVAAYDSLYPVYERLYGALRDTFADLAAFRRRQ